MDGPDPEQPHAGVARGFRAGSAPKISPPLATRSGGVRVVDPWDLPRDALATRIEELASLAATVEGMLVRSVGAFDAQELWRDDGAGGARSWLTFRTGDRGLDNGRRVRTAALLRRYPQIDEVLDAGSITPAHAAILARVAIGARRRVFERDLEVLLEAAMALDVDSFDQAAQLWASLADDEVDRPPPSEREQLDRRRLSFHDSTNGMVTIDGLLPAAAAGVVRATLDHLDEPDPLDAPEGPRPPAQRAADNLVELARRSMLHPNGRANPEATVLVTASVEVLAGEEGVASRLRDTHLRCGFADGRPLPPEAVRRFGCGAWVSQVLFSAENEILQMGRRQRLFTAAQRRAIAARDRGCVWPGCDKPMGWCSFHHLNPWADGGNTDVEDGCMLCGHHHTLVHEGGWGIRPDPDGGWTCFDPARTPRGSHGPDRQRRHPPSGPIPPQRPSTRRPHRHNATTRPRDDERRTGDPPRTRGDPH